MKNLFRFTIIIIVILNIIVKVNANSKTIIITRVDNQNNGINGSVIEIATSDGYKVGTYTTNLNGSVIVNNLYNDVYIIREIKSADGESISSDIATVDFTTGEKSIEKIVLTSTPSSNAVTIQVKNALNNEFVKNLSLTLFDLSQELSTHKTNENGEITIDNLRNSDNFYLINNEKLKGYEKLSAPIFIKFKNNKFNQVIYIEPVKIKIKLSDFDIGKQYGVFSVNNLSKDLDQNKEIFKIKITSEEVVTDYLTSGTYKLQEYPYKKDEGYIFGLDESIELFNISFNEYKEKNTLKENITLGIESETVKEALALSSIKHTISNVNVKSNVVLDKLYINISLPNGIFLERFFTGRYSQNKKFNIFYRLKGINEYYAVAKDVPTNFVQEIDLEKIKKNGVVTNILLEFLNIEDDFHEIESPFIYTYVSNLKNNSVIDTSVTIYTDYFGRDYKYDNKAQFKIFNNNK